MFGWVRGVSRGPAAIAFAAGLAAFLAGTIVESAIIRAVRGNRPELEWISDVVVSLGVVSVTYLWLHLRESRALVLSLVREQVAVGEQLRLAAEIQANLLPPVPQTAGLRWAARIEPSGRIGGDFYDFVEAAEDTVLVIVADVSGKGIPAALILSSLKMLFRSMAKRTLATNQIAEGLSASLHEEYSGVPYATAIVARVDPARKSLAYVNAGHPSGYLLRDDHRIALESGGPPLGLLAALSYAETVVRLEPGDIGVLMTDGVTEALETGPMTLDQALRAARGALGTKASPPDVCDALLRAAARGLGPRGAEGWQDDRTVVVMAVDSDFRGSSGEGARASGVSMDSRPASRAPASTAASSASGRGQGT
jgi:serine phosphatase RsbU (regulator of sigma subunit)